MISDEVKETKTKFRLNSQQLFLTYSQCPSSLDEIYNHLKSKLDIDKYIIAQEKHADGNLHIHCYLLLKKKVNIKDPRKLDYNEYHPKIEGCRSYKNVIKYVTKDGHYITNYDKELLEKIINENKKVSEIYTSARKRASEGEVDEAMKLLEHPKTVRDLTLHSNSIRKNLESLVPKRQKTIYSLDSFKVNFSWNRTRTLILWGPTETGKSSLAKALLPKALFVSHMDRLRDYDPKQYEGIIFDDMSFKHIPRDGQIHLVDTFDDRDIHCRYSPAFLPAGTPRIITSNNAPADILLAEDPAIVRRIQVVEIDTPIFTPSSSLLTSDLSLDSGAPNPFAWIQARHDGTGHPAS